MSECLHPIFVCVPVRSGGELVAAICQMCNAQLTPSRYRLSVLWADKLQCECLYDTTGATVQFCSGDVHLTWWERQQIRSADDHDMSVMPLGGRHV